eukprot:6689698-Pyramimonas_sp.AAC.1
MARTWPRSPVSSRSFSANSSDIAVITSDARCSCTCSVGLESISPNSRVGVTNLLATSAWRAQTGPRSPALRSALRSAGEFARSGYIPSSRPRLVPAPGIYPPPARDWFPLLVYILLPPAIGSRS